jgi:hypothetical protein
MKEIKMSTPRQVAFCNKCGASFHTMRAFKKHIKGCKGKKEKCTVTHFQVLVLI